MILQQPKADLCLHVIECIEYLGSIKEGNTISREGAIKDYKGLAATASNKKKNQMPGTVLRRVCLTDVLLHLTLCR